MIAFVLKDKWVHCVSGSESDQVHVVLDRHLVTGQNEASTLAAVQNLILLTNQR